MATVAQPLTIRGKVQRFSFTPENTIGDLLETVRDLEKRGRTPLLRFVGLTTETIEGIEIVAVAPPIEVTPAGRAAIEEMGVAGAEDNGECLLPDPAATRIPDSEPVIWEGEPTTWGSLSQNERMSCEANKDGVLEGGYPI